MIQSLVRKEVVDDLVSRYGHVVVDECHHIPAVSFERVLGQVRARYVTGLTATPRRRDGHHPIAEMQLGPVRHSIDARAEAAARPFTHKLIARETSFASGEERLTIQEIYRALARDDARNQMIARDITLALEQGRVPLVLTERRDHVDVLADLVRGFCSRVVVLRGGAPKAGGSGSRAAPPAADRVIVATGRFVGEGFDDPRLDTLFLTMPVSWKGTLIQYAGRIQRLHPAKREVRIYDYVDRQVPMLVRMFERRVRGYRSIGYSDGELPFALVDVDDDYVLGRGWEDQLEDDDGEDPPEGAERAFG
jgi:superfamily II DNA or RNA helicase